MLRVDEDGGGIVPLGAIPARGSLQVSSEVPQTDMSGFLDEARESIHGALVLSGLFDDESWAMVDTWAKSYFLSEGLRVLYVLPRIWTDELLPR